MTKKTVTLWDINKLEKELDELLDGGVQTTYKGALKLLREKAK